MYRTLVVDDEPAVINHICTIIATRCPQFEVTATAEHGREALKLMEDNTPDVLITDVKMPGMDGIALANKVKERYPQVFSLVVSGYHEFAYAKAAIKTGVYDYLLKPINPAVFQSAMNGICERLDDIYAKKRNLLMKNLCENNNIDLAELKRCFPAEKYHAAIVRKNGLPRRYFANSGFEIFSGKDEKIFLYGRDEMEALYLCPTDIPVHKSFYQIISETAKREYKDANYVTGIIRETPFFIENAGVVFEEIYQTLDNSIVVGTSQIVTLEETQEPKPNAEKESGAFRDLENYIHKGQRENIIEAVGKLFAFWKHSKKTQMYVEAQVRYLLVLLDKCNFLSTSERNSERILDEIFYFAEDMDEVSILIQNILEQKIIKEAFPQKMNTTDFFTKVTTFIHRHLADELSMKKICQEFGLSPTYLNTLFRKYSGHSFNKFLTLTRIERAKEIMNNEQTLYVKDVATRVGYNDQFYFSRIFTSVVKLSPSAYMEQLQKEGNTDV